MKKGLGYLVFALLLACNTHSQDANKTEKNSTIMKSEKSDSAWKAELSDEAYRVLRQCGTEQPGSGKYYNFYEEGTYQCAACESELFSSETKYSSGSGWPSFYDVLTDTSVVQLEDKSHGMHRIEVRCAQCGGHLGHVFPDGPAPTGKRYCINSVAMKFLPKE